MSQTRDERERVREEMRSGRRSSMFASCLQLVGVLVVGVLMLVGIANLIVPGRFPPARSETPTGAATSTPIVPVVVERIRSLTRLETMQFTVEWVIDQRRDAGGIIPGSERLLLIVHGEVVAGLDLAKLSPNDVDVVEGTVTLRLPAAEVLSVAINNERSYVYDYRKDWWVKGEPVELVGDALVRAEREIGRAAIEDGILDKAQLNGQSYLRHMMTSLGFTDIRFVVPTPTPTPSPTMNLTPVSPASPTAAPDSAVTPVRRTATASPPTFASQTQAPPTAPDGTPAGASATATAVPTAP